MRLITYDIELLEPVLVTALDGDPNSSISYNFIPGSAMRGALIGRYQKKHGDIEIDKVRALFFSNQTQFLNGYRTLTYNYEISRSWPLPLSLRREKPKAEDENSYQAYDFVWDDSAEKSDRVSTKFGLIDGADGREANIKRLVTIHTSRDREAGRSTRESGDIFNYEALAAHQTFRAYILTELDDKTLKPLIALIKGELHIGGTRSAGYGRVRLQRLETQETAEAWQNARYRPPNKDEITVTLLSDALLRDECGNWTTDSRQLAQAMGLELSTAYPAFRPIGGFNRKWGLPLPQRMAFKMGTVLVCKRLADEAKLKKCVLQGVGEGRLDGFGRIAVNWHTQPKFTLAEADKTEHKTVSISEKRSQKIAQDMVKRMWRTRLDAAVIAKANELVTKPQRKISKSQLYRLRAVIQKEIRNVRAQSEHTDAPLDNIRKRIIKIDKDDGNGDKKPYLEDIKSRRTPRQQFEKVRIDGQRMLSWIELLVKADATLAVNADLPKVGDVEAETDKALTLEYNLRLIDAVLAQIAKYNRKEERR